MTSLFAGIVGIGAAAFLVFLPPSPILFSIHKINIPPRAAQDTSLSAVEAATWGKLFIKGDLSRR